MWPPRSRTACRSLPPEGAAAPVVWQSQSRGPCWWGIVRPQSLEARPRAKEPHETSKRMGDPVEQGPWNRLCRATGAVAPSGGRALHAVSNRGGHIQRGMSTLTRRVPGGGSGKPRSAESSMAGTTAFVSLHTPSCSTRDSNVTCCVPKSRMTIETSRR